jgi:hypothetical protein
MTLSPKLDFGDVDFASIGFRRCRFRLNWIWAMSLSPQLDFSDVAFATIGFRR